MELTDSYILHYENAKNPFEVKRREIRAFIDSYRSHFIDAGQNVAIRSLAEEIKKSGVKDMDALHVACAIYGECDCFLTTDKRLLKYQTSKIKIQNPIFLQNGRSTS